MNTAPACTCKISLGKKLANPTMHRMVARTNLTRLYKSSTALQRHCLPLVGRALPSPHGSHISRPLNSQYLVVTLNISNTISISHYGLPFSQYFNPILTTGTLFLNISILQATPTLEKNFHPYPHMFKEAHGNFSVLVKYKLNEVSC